MGIVNWDLLKNPLNWIIVILMIIIAATAGHYVATLAGFEPVDNQS
jgi:ABC-type uncharacterized transport system permease subunit